MALTLRGKPNLKYHKTKNKQKSKKGGGGYLCSMSSIWDSARLLDHFPYKSIYRSFVSNIFLFEWKIPYM